MDKCIVNQLHNILPADVTALVDANPDVQLRVNRGVMDPTGRVLEGLEAKVFKDVADDLVAFNVHARQPLAKTAVGVLQLAGVSMYMEFSAPRLHVSAALNATTRLNATRFRVALNAEVNAGVFRDVPLNDSWVPGDTLFMDNNLLTCQLLIPQVTALTNMLRVLMANTPRTLQYTLSFARALRDYQLAKYRK